jgi:hypothetical protein
MSDYNSSLPVRTQNNGDVVANLSDGVTESILNTIKAASTAASATDTALVVAMSPNTPLPAGTNAIGSVTQGTTPWVTKDQADGSANGGAAGAFSILSGGIYNATPPTLTTGQQASLQLSSSGVLLVSSSGSSTVSGTLTNNNAAPTSNNLGVLPALAEATLSASRYTSGDQVLLVTDLAGNTNVDLQYYLGALVSKTNPIATTIADGTNVITNAISAYGTPPTGTEVMGVNAYITNAPTVNQGTPNSAANAWPISITSGGTLNSPTNPIFVSNTDIVGTPVDNYQTSASLAAGSSVTLTYTVTAGKTFYSKQFWMTASGKIKAEVQYAGTNFWASFNSTADPNIFIPIMSNKTAAAGTTVAVKITNKDVAALDVYATISGVEQ